MKQKNTYSLDAFKFLLKLYTIKK